MNLRLAIAAALLLGPCRPCRALQPTSDVRVTVTNARVTGLSCRRRAFKMEYTKDVALAYRHLARWTFVSDPDPRTVALGLLAMILTTPVMALAVPSDLVAGAFRRECRFEFQAQGALLGWAGRTAGRSEIVGQGANIISPGVEGESRPDYFVSRSSTTSDEQGRFSIALEGRVGRSPEFELRWLVDSLGSGLMSLRKEGGVFVLSEPEAEFGSSVQTSEAIVIRPQRKR